MQNLENKADRKARFRTVIALVLDGEYFLFEGVVEGEIIKEMRGDNGFGYDSVFVPEGSDKTFAEMTAQEKNLISHRYRAITALITYLRNKFDVL